MENQNIPIAIGKGEILKKGDDIIIFAIGATVYQALLAHTDLLDQGISSTVVNCRFVKPLDTNLIVSLAKQTPHIITVEENVRQGGFGSAVLECLSDHNISGCHVTCLGIPDAFVEHGPQDLLRSMCGIDAPAIVKAAKNMILT
jgi:1-deoxy-D-xylulose-5-phosphate synthase